MTTGPEIAAVITAVGTVVTAVGGLALAIGVLIPILRNSRKVVAATAEVHTMVNQQRTDMIRYQAALVAALHAAGIAVPADQSLAATVAPAEAEPRQRWPDV